MKSNLHHAAILGPELLKVFEQTYDEHVLPEIIEEAVRALRVVKHDKEWRRTSNEQQYLGD